MRGPIAAFLLFSVSFSTGCDTRIPALGAEGRFVLGAEGEIWDVVGEEVYAALESRILTTRPEKRFQVTYQDPREAEAWSNLRSFRREIVIGTGAEPWMASAISAHSGPPPEAPAIFQVEDVWARGQQVTVMLVPEGSEADAVRSLLPELRALLDGQYRDWVRRRMFMTPPDTALADTLATRFGFEIVVPELYRWSSLDSVVRLRNDNPTPAELIREVLVTWRDIERPAGTAEEIGAWRAEMALTSLAEAQVVDTVSEVEMIQVDGMSVPQVRGIWTDLDPEWPATGVFRTRTVPCPALDRVYLVDAWLYAPGVDKYQYIIQLETLLDTFRCAGMN